jgi:protein farnesyltransferase/geranylgeranyltransferase type-1 subunit alpha
LSSDLTEELNFMDLFAEENPKNYQIWHHRRVIVEELGDAKSELIFCSRVFKTDAKNYHAWAHRSFSVQIDDRYCYTVLNMTPVWLSLDMVFTRN